MKIERPLATTFIATAILIAAATNANADDGWYVGAAVGKAYIDESIGASQLKADSTTSRFYGGYSFNQNFALEASYLNLGTFRDSIDVGGMDVPVSAKADGFAFAVVGTLPLSPRISAQGRFGYYFHDGQSTAAGITENDPSDQNPFVGLGLSYKLNEEFEVNLAADYFDLEGTQPLVASVGLSYRF
jgi:OOP family OmpA-OmpF porin